MKSNFKSTKKLVLMMASAGLISFNGVSFAADIITPTVTTPAAPQPGAAPTSGLSSYTINVGSVVAPVLVTFAYDFATKTWLPPAGWQRLAGTSGVDFIDGKGLQLSLGVPTPPSEPSIVAGTPTTTGARGSTVTAVPLVSEVLGASTANGAVSSLGVTTTPYTVTPTTMSYTLQDVRPATPVTTTGVSASGTTTVVSSVTGPAAAVTGRVVVASTTPAYNNGSYTITGNGTTGTIAGSVVALNSSGLTVSNITGNATIDANGVITANPVTSAAVAITNTGITVAAGATLTVAGNIITNGITNTGNIAATTLNTTGLATLNSAAITNNATVGGTLAVTGATSVGGALAVTGPSTLGGTLAVTGATSLGGNLAVAGATTLASTLAVTGASTLASTLAVTGATTLRSTLGVTGAATLGSTLAVTGATTLASTVAITGATTLGSTLAVTGATSLTGALTANGGAVISNGIAIASGAGVAGNTLVVDGTSVRANGGGTSFTLNSSGATFGGASGAPVRVRGIADGVSNNDAASFGQVRSTYRGIAGVSALAAIPAPAAGKTFSVGLGYGRFKGEDAAAIGVRANFSNNVSVTIGASLNGQSTYNAGVGYSW